jgi:Mrp family chromosome partitioning ATPase
VTDDETGEAPIEARRYVDAVRRNLLPIVGFAFAVAIVVLIVSSLLTTRYEAEASIVMQDLTQLDQTASTDAARDLSTAAVYLKTTGVLRAAASRVPGETADSLSGHVRTRVDPNANFIYVTADDSSRDRAAAIANAVARAFVARHGALERAQAVRERSALLHQAAQLRRTRRAGEAAALGGRISDLGIAIADAGSDFAVAEPATAPASASSPHPLRDAGLAFVLALFIAVLVAVGREQLAPRLTGQRELANLLGLPVLGAVPTTPRLAALNGARPADGAVYRGLASSLARSLPTTDAPRVVLVTSAVRGEGKTTATAELARALAASGHRTLVIAADPGPPTLHDQFGVRAAPGVTDLLRARSRATLEKQAAALTRAIRHVPGAHRLLDVLPSGRMPEEAGQVLADGDVASLFEQIRALDYEYVLVDAPALVGDTELHALMRACDEVLYIAKLDRVTREQTLEARDRLERHGRRPLGMIVIGRRG